MWILVVHNSNIRNTLEACFFNIRSRGGGETFHAWERNVSASTTLNLSPQSAVSVAELVRPFRRASDYLSAICLAEGENRGVHYNVWWWTELARGSLDDQA